MAKHMTPAQELEAIRNKLRNFKLEWTPSYYLDTGSKKLNAVLGIREKGIPGGKVIEVSGPESNGKTSLVMDLMAIAQADGCWGLWFDAEHSLDKIWAAKRGIDTDNLGIVEPYEGYFGKVPKLDKKGRPINIPEMASAEVLCTECEEWIKRKHREDKDRPIFFVLDSVTGLTTAYELEQRISDTNMRSKLSLSSFLSGLLRRWIGLFQTHNVIAVFINQLRTDPNKMFGNPETTTGGKALRFYSHIRVRVGRKGESKSRILQSGEQIGIQGIIKNKKNKAGGIENTECGYKIFFDGSSKFCDVDSIKGGDE